MRPKRVIAEYKTVLYDKDDNEIELIVKITDYRPGKPEKFSRIPECYDPGTDPEVDFELYYKDGTPAKDLIKELPDDQYQLLQEEALEEAELWYKDFIKNLEDY